MKEEAGGDQAVEVEVEHPEEGLESPGEVVEVRPGRLLYVERHEGVSGTTVFLLHGLGGRCAQYCVQQRALVDQGHTVVTFDAVGHGRSPSPGKWAAWHADQLVEDIRTLFVQHKGDRNVLVGHSYGTTLAGLLLERAAEGLYEPELSRDMIHAVVLLGANLDYRPISLMLYAPAWLLELGRKAASSMLRKLSWHPDTNPKLIEKEETFTQGNTMYMIKALARQSLYPDKAKWAASIGDTPLLFVSGSADKLTPPQQALDWCAEVPHARHVMVERAGHMMLLETPALMCDTLTRFVAGEELGEVLYKHQEDQQAAGC